MMPTTHIHIITHIPNTLGTFTFLIQEPYVTSIEPLTGPVSGGTLITITGGLLTELQINNCELELECPKSECLDR